MFRLAYIGNELRRRRGRALLTALGLGLGIALVVAVTSLSTGLDRAQDRVFAPLAGVGTDLLVSRPVELGSGKDSASFASFAALPQKEQKALRDENEDAFVDPADLGKPGERFSADSFLPATQLTFPEAAAKAIANVPEVAGVGRALTVLLVHAEGEVPEQQGAGFNGGDIQISTATVAGVEKGELGLITPDAGHPRALPATAAGRRAGRVLRRPAQAARRLDAEARREALRRRRPGAAADRDADRRHLHATCARCSGSPTARTRVNLLLVRARDSADVAKLGKKVERFIPGIVASSSKDLAESVQGSLVGADDLRDRLATLLAIVALVAAVGIAALLMLASVAKRTRELGTLRALGWSRPRVVGLVLGESAALGALGALLGTALGVGAAALTAAHRPAAEGQGRAGGRLQLHLRRRRDQADHRRDPAGRAGRRRARAAGGRPRHRRGAAGRRGRRDPRRAAAARRGAEEARLSRARRRRALVRPGRRRGGRSRSPSRRASTWPSPAPRAPARPRCCSCSARWTGRRRARSPSAVRPCRASTTAR